MAAANTNMLAPESPIGEIEEIEDDIDKRFKTFSHFDILPTPPYDHRFLNPPSTDYYYSSLAAVCTKKRSALKAERLRDQRIKQECELLKSNLPNSVFVRAYSRRTDLMRVAVIGLDYLHDNDEKDNATEYHNPYGYGLFFFDVFFPPQYPTRPPMVFHLSYGGLSLESNSRWFKGAGNGGGGGGGSRFLSSCLGGADVEWDPEKSNLLNILGLIQREVLSPAAGQNGKVIDDHKCDEIMVMCHKAAVSTLRSPPAGFEDFVRGYYRKFSNEILVRFKGFLESRNVIVSDRLGSKGLNGRFTFEHLLKVLEENGSYCGHIGFLDL